MAMVVGNNKLTTTEKMQGNRWWFWLAWQCSSTTQGTLPDGAHPGLHSKGQWMPQPVECLCRIALAAAMVNTFEWNTQNTNKTQLLVLISSCLWEFQDPKQTLYSAHWCNMLCLNVKRHNWRWRACTHFQLSNLVRGQKWEKLLSNHKAR